MKSDRTDWKPTHRIRLASGEVIDVQRSAAGGSAFTRQEWQQNRQPTEYNCDLCGRWLRLDRPFDGTVIRL